MTHALTRINPPTLSNAAEMGYSQITTVEPGRMAFISGQVAWLADGATVPDDLVEQTKIVAANAKSALDAVAATAKDIVMARVYVVDLTPERQQAAMPHLFSLFEGEQPCVTGIGVSALGGVGLQIEMELVVRLPD